MMKSALGLLVLLVFSIFPSIVLADTSGPARSELERFVDGLSNFQAGFTQTVRSQDGRIQDQTSGDVWLQPPDKLRWVYKGDFPETIVADGRNIWIHDETLQQVTVKPQSDQAADSPLMILADISRLDQQFAVTELGDFEGVPLLELKSLDAESEFERILLGFDASGIRMMVMEDAFGQRTEIQFENVLKNEAVDQQTFSFTLPDNADVVGVPVQPD
jgi:outer membrane lipoprotein carrier protein